MNFEDLQLQVHPGPGLVARWGGAAVVLPQLSLAPKFDDELLALVAAGCEDYGPLPGRHLIRKLAGLITSAEPEEVSSFAVAAAGEDGLALMLCGSMDLRLSGGADEQVLSGRDVATWVDRVVREPFDRLVILPSGASAPEVEPRVDLRDGVVLGSGITFTARVAAAPPQTFSAEPLLSAAEPGPDGAAGSSPTPPHSSKAVPRVRLEPSGEVALPGQAQPSDEPPPRRPLGPTSPREGADVTGIVSVVFDEPLPEAELTPLPLATDEPSGRETGGGMHGSSGDEPHPDQVSVQGILCSRGHFNDPKARFCAQCGISMVHQTHNLTTGPRPALGVLVLDDGSTFAVDYDYVIGREPEISELVLTGRARPLVIEDPSLRLSRVHAHILLREWEVCVEDARSANGTRIRVPDSSEWITLTPGEPTPITPGTWIGLGDREFVYESHFGAG